MPSSIRKVLDELPVTLDDTYEWALGGISKEKWRHAHRLFHYLVAAIRPVPIEELGEIFAIELSSTPTPRPGSRRALGLKIQKRLHLPRVSP